MHGSMDVESREEYIRNSVAVKQWFLHVLLFTSHLQLIFPSTLWAWISQNGQTHSNILSAKADELLGCVWPLCGVGA